MAVAKALAYYDLANIRAEKVLLSMSQEGSRRTKLALFMKKMFLKTTKICRRFKAMVP